MRLVGAGRQEKRGCASMAAWQGSAAGPCRQPLRCTAHGLLPLRCLACAHLRRLLIVKAKPELQALQGGQLAQHGGRHGGASPALAALGQVYLLRGQGGACADAFVASMPVSRCMGKLLLLCMRHGVSRRTFAGTWVVLPPPQHPLRSPAQHVAAITHLQPRKLLRHGCHGLEDGSQVQRAAQPNRRQRGWRGGNRAAQPFRQPHELHGASQTLPQVYIHLLQEEEARCWRVGRSDGRTPAVAAAAAPAQGGWIRRLAANLHAHS